MSRNRIPSKFADISSNGVYNAEIPSGYDWKKMGQNIAYLNGKGSQLIPVSPLKGSGLGFGAGQEFIYEFGMFPNRLTLERCFQFSYQSASLGGEAASTSTGLEYTIDADWLANPVTVSDWVSSGGTLIKKTVNVLSVATDQTDISNFQTMALSGTFSLNSGSLIMCSMFELPRSSLDVTGTYSNIVDEESLRARMPIFADVTEAQTKSVRAVAYHISSSVYDGRRAGIYFVGYPIKIGGQLNSETTLDFEETPFSIFDIALPGLPTLKPKIQARRIFRNQSSGTLDVYAHIWSSETTSVEMILSSSTSTTVFSSSVTMDLQAEVPAWISGTIETLVDGTTGNQLPTGETEAPELDILFRDLGSATSYFVSVIVGEKDPRLPEPSWK